MAILPINLARVSNSLRLNLAQRSLTRTQQALVEVQNQLSTGKRLTSPSDDPTDAAVALQLRKTLEQRQGFSGNLQQANSQLSQVDSSLGDLTDLLRQAQTIASANVGSDVSADARSAAASVIDSIYNQALSIANTQFQGTYLFAGDKGSQPFVVDSSGVRYTGSEQLLKNRFDENSILPFMADGNQIFGALSTRITGAADLTPAVTASTRLVDLRGAGGDGVQRGAITLSNGTTTKTVDLSQADTVGDVVNLINASSVGGITAAISADGRGITLSAAAADNITVNELGSTTAADLGFLTTTASGVGINVVGQAVNPNVTSLTKLADLKGGAGIDLSGLLITNGLKTAHVDLSGAVTVEDMLNKINSSGTGVLARLSVSGKGIDILNPVQGAQMMIAENGGTTAADLGLRSFSPSTPLTELNGGKGIRTAAGADLTIARQDGSSFSVDLDGAQTIGDVINAVNSADGGGGVTASFTTMGNGIVLSDSSVGTGTLTVTRANYSLALEDLGLNVPAAGSTITGKDVNAVSASGIFGNLSKLRDALRNQDQNAITQAAQSLDEDLSRVQRVHGQVGAQVKDIESRQQRLEDQNTATQSLLSTLQDTDFNEAVTRFQSLQTALQANLQTTGKILNQSLLDFLS